MFILKISVNPNPALRSGIPEILIPTGYRRTYPTIKELKEWKKTEAPDPLELASTARVLSEVTAVGGTLGILLTRLPITELITAVGTVGTIASWLLEPELNVTKDRSKTQTAPAIEDPAAKLPDPAELPAPLHKPRKPKPIPGEGEPISPIEDPLFKECMDEVSKLKVSILRDTLEKSEERGLVTKLLNVLRAPTGKKIRELLDIRTTTGKNPGLSPDNHLKLRIFTLDLLKDIIVNSKNEQTINRPLEAIFNIFMQDGPRAKLRVNAGTSLLAVILERNDTLDRLIDLDSTITKDSITTRLEQIKK